MELTKDCRWNRGGAVAQMQLTAFERGKQLRLHPMAEGAQGIGIAWRQPHPHSSGAPNSDHVFCNFRQKTGSIFPKTAIETGTAIAIALRKWVEKIARAGVKLDAIRPRPAGIFISWQRPATFE
jgi:hypothetical protein